MEACYSRESGRGPGRGPGAQHESRVGNPSGFIWGLTERRAAARATFVAHRQVERARDPSQETSSRSQSDDAVTGR